MSSYRPASVAEAGNIIGPKLGRNMTDDRRGVVTVLNQYRAFLYNLYEQERLFDNVFHCFAPVRFHNECSSCSPCDRCYHGFTLPREMAGVQSAWQWGYPLRVRGSWRESFTGRAPSGGDLLDVVEVRESFPTERDLQAVSALQVYADSFGDAGKVVVIHGENTDRKTIKVEFTLEGQGTVSDTNIFRRIHNVVLPVERNGSITLANTEGYELSRYAPNENHVPAYKRYKIPGRCAHNILVQGTRQLVEVWFDEDIVEIGDRNVLGFMGTYYKYIDSLDQREVLKAEQAKANALKELKGLVSRDDGGRLPQPVIYGKPKCGLPGYGRRYRGILP